MIELSPAAASQVAGLESHYQKLGRPEAIRNLARALVKASDLIEQRPQDGLPAPRPYPQLAKSGRLWLQVRPYWVAYSLLVPIRIVGVFYDAADIPKRV